MVTVGETTLVPFTLTVPMPWLMEAEVPLVEDQERVVEFPATMGFGDAVMLTVGVWSTDTVTLSVIVPPGPVAVMV